MMVAAGTAMAPCILLLFLAQHGLSRAFVITDVKG